MTNNDILRRLRFTFDLKDNEMVEVFGLAELNVSKEEVNGWLKKEDDEAFSELIDVDLAAFLNGFISLKRGKREGEQPVAEEHLSNNMIFQKLRIALNLKAEDILDILKSVDIELSKHELSAFFRKPENKHYRECKGQVLRNFLLGIQHLERPDTAESK